MLKGIVKSKKFVATRKARKGKNIVDFGFLFECSQYRTKSYTLTLSQLGEIFDPVFPVSKISAPPSSHHQYGKYAGLQ